MSLRSGLLTANAVPPFLPSSISNLQVWLDPTDNGTITQSSGKCSQINDKSTNAYQFKQTTGTLQPAVTSSAINSKQCFTFDNTNGTYLQGTLSGKITTSSSVFCLVKPNSVVADTTGYFITYQNSHDLSLCAAASNSIEVWLQGATRTAAGSANAFQVGTAYWIGFTYDSTGSGTITTYVNNVQVGQNTQGGTPAQINNIVGWGNLAAWAAPGNFVGGDVVVYNALLSSTDRGNLYTKFAKPKWGLP